MTREPAFPPLYQLAMLGAVAAWCTLYIPVLAALVLAERVRR